MTYGYFAAIALIHICLLVWSFRLTSGIPVLLIRALLIGMTFDNTVLAIGAVGIDSEAYQVATVTRYALHALLLPLIVIMGLLWLRRQRVAIAGRTWFAISVVVLVVAGVVYGLAGEVLGLELVQRTALGHRRLVDAAGLPPFATIFANLVLMTMAFAVWRRSGWPWLFLGCLFIFVVNAATGAQEWAVFAGNAAEVVFAMSLLATHQFLWRPAPTPA